MIIDYKGSFLREIKKLKDKGVASKLKEVIADIKAARNILEIKHIRKMEGFPHHYRIKIDDHRIGAVLSRDIIILVRFLDRKEIYRYFPER